MKVIKVFSLKKVLSFLIVFTLIFSQNSMMVFADMLSSKSKVKIYNNSDNKTNNEKDKSNQQDNDKNSSGSIHNDLISKENSNKKELSKEDVINENIKNNNSIKEYNLKRSSSGELISIGNLSMGDRIVPSKLPKLVKGQLPFPNYKGGYYYDQLSNDRKIAYQVYLWLIENVKPGDYIDVSSLELEQNDFYAINDLVLMENPEIFHARGVQFCVDEQNQTKVSKITYQSPFELDEIKRMKTKLDDAYKLAVDNIKSSLDKNYTKLDAIRAIYDYVGKTVYGGICEESVHPDINHYKCPKYYKQHSIYGVFVERRAVCEGNSYAIVKLAKEFGINALVDGGTPKVLNIPNHMWNLIQMDDEKWYICDSTADGVSYNNGENKFYNFLIGENNNRLVHEHDPYFGIGYNEKFKIQKFSIPELAQESYVKLNVVYPSINNKEKIKFYRNLKDALNDIKKNNLSGIHKILLTDDYNLTNEEVTFLKAFKTDQSVSFEISSVRDPYMLRYYSLGSETKNLYLPDDTKFCNINYDIENLYTQGNKASFGGEIANIFGKSLNIYLGQKDGKSSDLQIESGAFNEIHLAKDDEVTNNKTYNNDINFMINNGSIRELYISDNNTITGNINLNISNLASISNIHYGDNIRCASNKKLSINISGGAISKLVENAQCIDSNVDINVSGGHIGYIIGPTVRSDENSIKTTNIRVSGQAVVNGIYGEIGNVNCNPNNNIILDLNGVSTGDVDLGRATKGKTLVKLSGLIKIENLIDFDEVRLLDNAYLKVNQDINYYMYNHSRLGKLVYEGSNSQLKLPRKQVTLNKLENKGNNNILIISTNDGYLSLLDEPILSNKLILKYFDNVRPNQNDKIIEFPSGYKIDLNKFENQIDLAHSLEIDPSGRFIQLGKQNTVSYIDTTDGTYPYKGEWGKQHILTSPKAKSDEITLEEGKLPYKNFEEGYYYKQLKDINKKIAYQIYYYIAMNLKPDEFLDVSNMNLDPNDFYATFDIVLHENPKIFWGRDIVVEVNGETNKVSRVKYYTPFSKEELSQMKMKFDKAIEVAVNNIKSNLTETSSKLEKVKVIHDYLIKNNHYGSDTCPEKEHHGEGHLKCKGQYIEHSAYGALVKTEGYGVVCEGFGTAFNLLSKHFGIESIFDAGPNNLGTVFHLWNYVKMEDNKWYLLDLTFDKVYSEEGKVAYNLFLVGKNNPAFKFKHDSYLSGIWNSVSKAQIYDIPQISKTSYINFEVIYPDNSRNVFSTFNDVLDDLKNKNLEGKHTIILRDDYTLSEQEVQNLKEYTSIYKQTFDIKSCDEAYMNKLYSLKSQTGKIYFPMDVSISNISYDIENTYVSGNNINIGEFVETSNKSIGNSIYLMAKQNSNLVNDISINSGSWKKIVGAYSENKTDDSHNGDTNISINGGNIEEVILSSANRVTGNINLTVNNNANIKSIKYGENINLNENKNININILGGNIEYFYSNESPISANTNINISGGNIEGLMGPIVFNKNIKTTNINVTDGTIGAIVGGGAYEESIKNNNNIVINISNIKNIKRINGILYGDGTVTININDDIQVESITDFDSLIIGTGKTLEMTKNLNYNQMKGIRKGLVQFSGKSKLILPEIKSSVGSLKSLGTLNKLVISEEEAYLEINERQVTQQKTRGNEDERISISYDTGLLPQNGDEILKYRYKNDIDLNNFINDVGEDFKLYNDQVTGSVRLILANYPIKVKYKNGETFEYASLYDALEDVEQEQNVKASEVKFYINGDYCMTEDDLIKLESYSSLLNNQKFIFTSEDGLSKLSTSDDVVFPVYNKLGEIEFTNIILDFDNKNIFASGSNLIMSESVKMTQTSNIDLYGGLFETEVTNSKLTLEGGIFNNIYGGGSSSNSSVLNNTDISLNKNVLVRGNVYGGSDSDRTGSSESEGIITINLLGGRVNGEIVGDNNTSSNKKVVINYGNKMDSNGTDVKKIYGVPQRLQRGNSNKEVDININKNSEFEEILGFSNLNIIGSTLKVLNKLNNGELNGNVKLSELSSLYIPNSIDKNDRKIGSLQSVGLNDLYIYKGKYLVVDRSVPAQKGNIVNILYAGEGLPQLDDKVVNFTTPALANNENFKTDYKFNISAHTTSGFLYLSPKTYKIDFYNDADTIYKTIEVPENSKYTFKAPEKVKGKKFVKWQDKDQLELSYQAGDTIDVNRDISVKEVSEEVEEYTVTLKVDGKPYKTDYVEVGGSYTFPAAPLKPEKYFIGWLKEDLSIKNLQYNTSSSMIRSAIHVQPGTIIKVSSDLTYNATYGKEVKYDVDYGNGNDTVQDRYYEGGSIKVPSSPPPGIKIPFGKIFGGFRAIFNGIGDIIGGIGSAVGSIFRPGAAIVITPGIQLEAVWVNELHINIYDENNKITETKTIGEGFDYTIPKAKDIEGKEFLYWVDSSNSNKVYYADQKIEVESNMDLKPVYKNTKVVRLTLDNRNPRIFKNFTLALEYAKNITSVKNIKVEFLENYTITSEDINTLKEFNRDNVNFVITGVEEDTRLKLNDSIMLPADTKFEHIVLDYGTDTGHGIYARGHRLEMGDKVSMKGTGSPILIGGKNGEDVQKSEIIVRSGRYTAIYGGGYSERSGVHGDITITLLDGEVVGDIYAGSHNTGLLSSGTTNINLEGGKVSGLVSGASKVLGLENSNHVNIRLLGTTLENGQVYGGYALLSEENDNIGDTTIYVGQTYVLNRVVGFTKLDIKEGFSLNVTEILNHKGGIRVTENSGEICLNGNSKLVVPSADDVLKRQVGWLNSTAQGNKIVVDKNKYLSLTSTKDDEIDNRNRVILDFKNNGTSQDISRLLKYENKPEKADATKFIKGDRLPGDLFLKGDEISGDVYIDVKDVLRVTKPDKQERGFKTIQRALQTIKLDKQAGEYTITLLENYILTNNDINALKDFNRNGVSFVIKGLEQNVELAISNSILLSTDTKFEDIVLDYNGYTRHGIYARGHKLEMGNNISMKDEGCPTLIGGENGKDVDKSEIIVRSGLYKDIYGGGFFERSGVHGNVKIELYDGKVTGDIYGGSQNTGLMSGGTTDIKLIGGTVDGIVSGASKVLGLENSNNVNIQLLGAKLNRGEVYGGYVELSEDDDNTGDTTIYVEDTYILNKLIGFTKLDIKEGYSLNVNEVLNHKGGIRVTDESGQICLNGSSKLVVPSTEDVLKRQVGWIKSTGENNKIVVNKGQYLNLTSTKPDDIDNNKITIDFKNPETSKDTSTLIKYENNKQKADATKFTKGSKLPSGILLKDDKAEGTVYIEEEYSLTVTKPKGEVLRFKTIESAINSVQLDNQQGEYTITLCENYKVTGYDVDSLIDFNRQGVRFVIKGLNNDVELTVFSNLILSTDTKFENIVLNYVSCTDNVIFARGHKLEMGNNIRMKDRGCPSLVGGDIQGDVSGSNIIVRSGLYKDIYGGGFTSNSGVRGNVNIDLYGGEVTGSIYGGSKDTGSMIGGTTTINLRGGKLYGIVSGTSKVSGLESTNAVNIHLLGTEFKNGEVGVYGGFTDLCEDSNHTGYTTIFVERPYYTVSSLVGFDKLKITQGNDLTVNEVLNHKGGIKETSDSGQICLDGNAKLVVPSTSNDSNRQAGWLKSNGENNKIVIDKDKYLGLTSCRSDEICNPIILDFKTRETSKEISTLVKYEGNPQKANAENFTKGANLPCEVLLKDDQTNGTVYMEEEYYLTVTKPQEEVLRFKTIQSAIQNIKSDTQPGQYTITLCKNYSLTNQDINELKGFNRKEVSFVIKGLDKTVELAINNSIMLSTDTKFEDIVLNYNGYTRHGIYARGHKLEMGNNISMKDDGCPTLIGGENGKDVDKSEIIVRSGLYKDIYGGGFFERSGVHGNVKIELYDGKVTGDIYGGSQNTGLISTGTTDIKLIGGEVSGLVSGASKVLGLENSNHVNIQLLGTTLNRGEVYGGYTSLSEDNDDTGITTISIGQTYTLNKLVGFTKLDIKAQVELTVNEVLNHKGGIRVIDESGQICLNGNSTLIVPSATDVSNRQAGWLKSTGQCNKIVVDKNKYLNLTSTRDDDIDKNNPIILDFKTRETSTDISTLLKYEYNVQKADASNFKKGSNLPCDLVLKGDETSGDVYIDGKDVLRVTKPDEKVREFKTIQKAIQNIKSDRQTGEYTITLLENYTLTNEDIVALRDFNRNGVSFVIRGLKDDTRLSINDSIRLSTDTKFEDIVLNYGSITGHGIYARGHKLEMGQHIEMKGTGSPILIGGDNGVDVDKSEIIVNSGRYTAIYGGGYLERSGVHGNITITISGGEVIGDIYAGSQNTGLISTGTTNINLEGGTVGGLVSGASKVLGLENSNHVNIQLLGTTLNRGEVYGGYTSLSEDNDNTGDTTIYVEDTYTLNKLVGFTKLDIKEGYSLNVNEVLNHKGGIRVTENSGEICLNGSSKLIVASTDDVSKRQAGWIKSSGENNKIVVNKDQYLNLTSTKDDDIDTNNPITLDFKNPETSKDTSTLIKYANKPEKADATKFTKGPKLPSEILLKDDKAEGTVFVEDEYSLTVTKPDKKVLKFKTIQSAINSVQSDNQTGEYTVTLCENYTVTGYDVDSLIDFSRPNVNFVIKGLNNDVELTVFSNLILSADTKFENIMLNYDTCTNNVIFARGHKLEMGNNIRMKDRGCPSLVGGDIQGDVCQSNIIVRSGLYKDIYGGGFTANSGVHGNVNIEIYGGEVTGDIYGGSKDTGSMTCGTTNINLRGGKVYGIVSGTSKVSGLESTNAVNIHLLGTEFKNGEVGVYGGFTNLCEDSNHTGYTTIFVERPQYTVSSLVGFDKLEITPGNDLAVTEVLNHKGGIQEKSNSGQICLEGNAKLVVPSTLNESNRQAGWINSLGEGNKIVFTTRNAYLNLTSTRDIMHQGCPVELTFDNMILNDSKTYLIRYQNNKDKLNINNFIVGKNLGKNSIFNIEDDKLYSIKDTRIYVPEASYMMIIKHSEKILGVQNSNKGSNVMQLTHPYGQYYGPFEDYSYWSFVKQPNGNYKIVNNKSHLLLTVENGSLSSNTFVIQDSDHGDNDLSQQWRVNVESTQEVTFDGFTSTAYNVYIENVKSSKVLDIRYGSLSDGAPLIQYDNNNGQNQKFLLVKHIGSHLKEGNLDVIKPDRELVKFNTMQSAIREIKSDTQEGTYTITVCKNYSLTDSDINELKDLGRSNVSFVIKGLNQNIELKVENSIELSGDTKFENIKLDYGTNNGHGIYARGHRLEMGQNITMKSSGGPILIGGDNGSIVNKSEIIVKSGTYPAIYGGGYLEDSGVNGTVEIGVSGGQIGDIYGGSMLASRMSGGDINIRLSGGSLTGIVSGGCKNSSKENLSDVNIYLFGTKLGENAKVYGGFAENTENTNFEGRSTIYVGQDYSVNTIAGFRTLKVFTNARLEVKNKLNHACGISTNADSGELLLNGNAQIKIPSSLWESDRQVGWINSIGSYNKIVFTTRDAYLNLTSTRDVMHQGCPVELTFDNMILNDSKTYLIKYANNRDRLNINNFIAGRNLGEKAIFKIEDDKLYSIKDTKIHVPEESYMMIVKHSRKIVGVQNSNQGSNVMQLTHPYGQYYGPYEDYSYWKFVKLANGNYKIVNNKSHLVLSVKNGSTSSNALVIQDSYHGDSDLSQQWKVEVEGTEELTFGGLTSTAYHVCISNAKTDKVLDVRGGSFSDGAPLIQYDNNNGQNQKFLLVKHIGRPLEE